MVVPVQLVGAVVALMVTACQPAAPPPPPPSAKPLPAAAAPELAPEVDAATMSLDEVRFNVRGALEASCTTCLDRSENCELTMLLKLSPNGRGALERIEKPYVEADALVCIREQLSGILTSHVEPPARLVRAELRAVPASDCIRERREAAAQCHRNDLLCLMRASRVRIKDAPPGESCDYAFTLLE